MNRYEILKGTAPVSAEDPSKDEKSAEVSSMDKPRPPHWNWRRALGNLLTLAVLASWGVVVYMMFIELAGG